MGITTSLLSHNNMELLKADAAAELHAAASQINLASHQFQAGSRDVGLASINAVLARLPQLESMTQTVGLESARELHAAVHTLAASAAQLLKQGDQAVARALEQLTQASNHIGSGTVHTIVNTLLPAISPYITVGYILALLLVLPPFVAMCKPLLAYLPSFPSTIQRPSWLRWRSWMWGTVGLLALCGVFYVEHLGADVIFTQLRSVAARQDAMTHAAIPTGTMWAYAGSSTQIPSGWLLCDGRNLDTMIAAESNVFQAARLRQLRSVLGTQYDHGKTGAAFLPDTCGRVIVGSGQSQNAAAAAARDPSDPEGKVILEPRVTGQRGGKSKHTLTVAEMPAHSHTGRAVHDAHPVQGIRVVHEAGSAHGGNHVTGFRGGAGYTDLTGPYPGSSHWHPLAVDQTGGNAPHTIEQPWLAATYIIKV